MLSNNVQDIIALPSGSKQKCPILLDAHAVNDFLQWLSDNPTIERRLREDRSYDIGVIKNHLVNDPHWNDYYEEIPISRNVISRNIRYGLRKRLLHQGIRLIAYNSGKDASLISDIQYAYFGNDPYVDRQSAEILAYGRKYSTDGRPVRIISRHRGFRSTPNTILYNLALDEIGVDNKAAYLRALAAVDLHDKVVNAAYKRFESGDYPTAIVETVKAFFAEVSNVVALVDPEMAKLDGYNLVHQAFDGNREKHDNKTGRITPERLPKIKLNALDKSSKTINSEWNEQKGFHDIGCGAVSAIRNPISHDYVDEAFIRDRFGNPQTALKFMCQMSLLFEKLDQRAAPW